MAGHLGAVVVMDRKCVRFAVWQSARVGPVRNACEKRL
jgi:hypothetical protein